MTYKSLENATASLMLVFLLTYLFFALQYPLNEFSRPYLVCVYLIAFTAFLALCLRTVTTIGQTSIKEAVRFGAGIGAVISLIFLTSNYIVRTEVELHYEVLSVTQGKGDSVNWKVKLNTGETFSLNVRKKYSSTHRKLTFYKGLWGYYFGKTNMAEESVPNSL